MPDVLRGRGEGRGDPGLGELEIVELRHNL